MKLLFLTQYFPPEVGAPQNRIYEMARELSGKGHDISVLTGMPNYPSGKILPGYKGNLFLRESMDNIRVYRSWLYARTTNNVFLRLVNYFSFTISSFIAGLCISRSDVIIVESPPLFLGITGFLLSRLKRMRFVFNISDLWPESAVKLGVVSNRCIIRLAEGLEMFLYKRADLITVQTRGIYKSITSRGFAKNKVEVITNGVDIEFLRPMIKDREWLKKVKGEKRFIIGYLGNHGIAQKLDTIIEAAVMLVKNRDILFLLAGDGPEKNRLIKSIRKLKLTNIRMLPVQKKNVIPELLSVIDLCIVPLRKLDLFKG
ncbi:MAG: glycosyltransferase family 4 protein, partial [Spirochaetes bacterium]|nr:glycosyltransferase family 4 protein [Spirochaetota bacterium]